MYINGVTDGFFLLTLLCREFISIGRDILKSSRRATVLYASGSKRYLCTIELCEMHNLRHFAICAWRGSTRAISCTLRGISSRSSGGASPNSLRPSGGSRDGGYRHFRSRPSSPSTLSYLVPAGLAVLTGGYVYDKFDRAPLTHRGRLIFISLPQELSLGISSFHTLLSQHTILPRTHPSSVLVRDVFNDLIHTLDPALRSALLSDWAVAVAVCGDANAVCVPGGRVLVTTGLLELTNGDVDELAAVLGHELAHAVLRHAGERMGVEGMTMMVATVMNWVFNLGWMPGAVGRVATGLRYGRKLEIEADRVGVQLAADAGYRLGAMGRVLDKLETRGGGKGWEWISTHPDMRRRREHVERYEREWRETRSAMRRT